MTESDRDFIMLMFALTECRRALDNLSQVDHLAKVRYEIEGGVERRENLRIFDHIRLSLQMAANVSRMFWPPKNKARGEQLRGLTGLTEDHKLSNRTLRNHIEHLDERLDDWTANSPRPFLAVELVLHDDYPASGEMRDNVHAATAVIYDAKSQSVQLFGDVFSLPELKDALEDVLNRTSEALGTITANWK